MSALPRNRAERRALAAQAARLAARLARTALDYDRQGELRPVTDARAVRVLQRGFEHMLRAGGEPHVLRLDPATAAAFPRGGEPPVAGAVPWLGVALDCEGRAAYALRWIGLPGCNAVTARRVVEDVLLAEMASHLARPGFPPWTQEAQP